MNYFLGTSEVLQLVVGYIGFSPGRFYLKNCSRYLHHEVDGVVHLNEADFLEALSRKLVNPKYLKLHFTVPISDSLISEVLSANTRGSSWRFLLVSLLQDRSVDELIVLGNENLETVLACSILRMNVSLFDTAMKCFEKRTYGRHAAFVLLRDPQVRKALMDADALEMLTRMVQLAQPRGEGYFSLLLFYAIQYRARRCEKYLGDFTPDLNEMDGMLEALAYAGDLGRAKTYCAVNKRVSMEHIGVSLRQAMAMQHVEVCVFLCDHAKLPDWHRRMFIEDWFAEVAVDPSVEFLTWLFEGLDDLSRWEVKGNTLLEIACAARLKRLCHFLVSRGCTWLFLKCDRRPKLGKHDLLDLLDFCCGLAKDCPSEEPKVELFLLQRGIHIRDKESRNTPIFEVLAERYKDDSLASRVDLIKAYLKDDPNLATKAGLFYLRGYWSRADPWLTPLGALELLGTPISDTWTGETSLPFADCEYAQRRLEEKTDEWTRWQPNGVEIQALHDIRTALLEHGANPDYLFEPFALNMLNGGSERVTAELINRVIHGRGDVNHKDEFGCTPLIIAIAEHLEIDITRHLLDQKADPNLGEPKGSPPLSWVLESRFAKKKMEIADILVEYKADINAKDECGRTAIFRAIARNDVEVVQWMIGKGADLTLSNSDGVRPIDLAKFGERTGKCSRKIVEEIERIIGQTQVRDIAGFCSVLKLFPDDSSLPSAAEEDLDESDGSEE